MKNRWKILCGIVTMSTILASTGCVNIRQDLKEAREAVEEATGTTIGSDENENDSYLNILSGGQLLEFGDSDEDADVYTGPADLAVINELPQILRNSDLPRRDSYSSRADFTVCYFNPEIGGYINIVCYKDGSAEILYDSGSSSISLVFTRPSGTYLNYSVYGRSTDNASAPVIAAYDLPVDGEKFAEISKDLLNNAGDHNVYYDEFEFTADLEDYENNLNIIFARYGIMSNEALGELGLTWEDFGINFGEEYKKFDAYAELAGSWDKNPLFLEKQTFTDGVSDTTGKTWVQAVREGIKTQAIYHSREDEIPTDWFAYNEVDSNNFLDGSDYVQIETHDESDSFMVYYHSGGYEDEDRYASRVFYLNFYDDGENNVSVRYSYQTDYRGTDTPGVVSSDTNMGFGVYCKSEEMKDIFASTESLKAYLEEQGPNSLYEESEYMSNDEMIKDFMTHYKRYMGSIDDNIKTMGTCLADYGIEY
jgi:hypothetical protein